jgi:UDP-2-acetamido-3-amino-2,3-dideoxy-glucuronate N-acetyltransferase
VLFSLPKSKGDQAIADVQLADRDPQIGRIVKPAQIHATADVSADVAIGDGTLVWHHSQVREGARIGTECIIGKGVYIDVGVVVGNCCKLQNSAFLFHGALVEDGVFLGPGTMLLNDRHPRAINPDGTLKSTADWEVHPVRICYGASVGAGSVILPGVTVGRFALVAAGAVVVRNVPDHGLVAGNPARLIGWACECGRRLKISGDTGSCQTCGRQVQLDQEAAGTG